MSARHWTSGYMPRCIPTCARIDCEKTCKKQKKYLSIPLPSDVLVDRFQRSKIQDQELKLCPDCKKWFRICIAKGYAMLERHECRQQ